MADKTKKKEREQYATTRILYYIIMLYKQGIYILY